MCLYAIAFFYFFFFFFGDDDTIVVCVIHTKTCFKQLLCGFHEHNNNYDGKWKENFRKQNETKTKREPPNSERLPLKKGGRRERQNAKCECKNIDKPFVADTRNFLFEIIAVFGSNYYCYFGFELSTKKDASEITEMQWNRSAFWVSFSVGYVLVLHFQIQHKNSQIPMLYSSETPGFLFIRKTWLCESAASIALTHNHTESHGMDSLDVEAISREHAREHGMEYRHLNVLKIQQTNGMVTRHICTHLLTQNIPKPNEPKKLFQTKFSNLIICGLWDFIVFSSRVHR